MASTAVKARVSDSQSDDNSGLEDAVWDALQDSGDEASIPEPDSPAIIRSRRSFGDGGQRPAIATAADTSPAAATHAAPQQASDKGRQQETASLASLPTDLLLRVLAFLSAEDLTSGVAPACRAFRHAAEDAASWRRLFVTRWGSAQGSTATDGSSISWKACYMERDRLELQEIKRRIPPPMLQYYLQMTVSRRSEAPKSGGHDGCGLAEQGPGRGVAAWRAARGFRPPPLAATHGCAGRPTFTALPGSEPPVFLCERCGWAHVCDDACQARIVDPATGTLVCPISGFCSGRLLTEEEEAAQLRGRGEEEFEPLYGTGRLAKAYLDGYMCADEAELQQLCGAQL